MDYEEACGAGGFKESGHGRDGVYDELRVEAEGFDSVGCFGIEAVGVAEVVLHINDDEGGGLGVYLEVHGLTLPYLICVMRLWIPRLRSE